MSEEAQPAPVEETVPVEFSIRTTYSSVGTALQKGSRYSFGPVPTAVEYEIALVDGGEWLVWVWHTPAGVQRYAMPKQVAEDSWKRLGQALGASDPKIEGPSPDGQQPPG